MNMLHEIVHILTDTVRNTILIAGLVTSMMMMIEVINTRTSGRFFKRLKVSGIRQIVLSSILGIIPGCMGGFAAVSLYTHRMISFGALTAMMIASSGDEAFVMLAMFPDKALLLTGILFCTAIATGIVIDLVRGKGRFQSGGKCTEGYEIHETHDMGENESKHTFGWKRILLLAGTALFIAALVSGILAHDHGAHAHQTQGHFNLLDEDWMNIMFGIISIFLLGVLITGSNHLVEEHLWNHIIKKHLLTTVLWTFTVLFAVQTAMHLIDIQSWITDNTVILILVAAAVGIIPESGPHLVFVTLFATGSIPLSVLAASSISQDGHASIPLLAEDKKGFLKAKGINFIIALAVGFAMYAFGL